MECRLPRRHGDGRAASCRSARRVQSARPPSSRACLPMPAHAKREGPAITSSRSRHGVISKPPPIWQIDPVSNAAPPRGRVHTVSPRTETSPRNSPPRTTRCHRSPRRRQRVFRFQAAAGWAGSPEHPPRPFGTPRAGCGAPANSGTNLQLEASSHLSEISQIALESVILLGPRSSPRCPCADLRTKRWPGSIDRLGFLAEHGVVAADRESLRAVRAPQ